MLSKLGYSFDPKGIEDWKVQAFNVVEEQISRCEEREIKKKR